MIPANYTLQIVENANELQTFTISGITNSTGYSAEIDIRSHDRSDSRLILELSSPNSGITLSASPSGLSVTIAITKSQRALIAEPGITTPYWSLKITDNSGITSQYLKGPVSIIRTTTV